jgi:hypothetical protein
MFKKFFDKRAKIVEETDPDRIYVENVRSFLSIPTRWAKFICEIAVKQNIFRKKYAVICINSDCQRVIKSYDNKIDIPKEINCLTCELGGKENHLFETEKLEIEEFYQLIEQ